MSNKIYTTGIINNLYYWRKYDDLTIIFMKANGYINATKICQQIDNTKRFRDWKTTTTAKDGMNQLSEIKNIAVDDLMIIVRKNNNRRVTGTYVHPILFTQIASWISSKFLMKICLWIDEWIKYSEDNENLYYNEISNLDLNTRNSKEKIIQIELQKQLNAEIEVTTPAGDIDILTHKKLIEIKSLPNWKCALGQLLAYGTYYPEKEKQLYLFDVNDKKISHIKKICKNYDVKVIIYD